MIATAPAHIVASAAPAALPLDLDLTLVSRRPARLPDATLATAMALPIPLAPPQPPGSPRASIVVVTYNNLPFTKLCLASVLANTTGPDGAAYELIAVDNASTDGTADYLQALSAANRHVRTIFNDTNRGFAPANNQGLAAAVGDVLVLLNNDTIVPPEWLERLCAHLRDPALGLLGPVTNRIGNEAEVEVEYVTYGEYVRAAEERAQTEKGVLSELPTPCMFCLALRRDTFERVGAIDERFEVGMLEDDDYAIRARQAGYRCGCADEVLVHHFGQASFGGLVPGGEYGRLLAANKRRYAEKWGREWQPYQRRPSQQYQDFVDCSAGLLDHLLPKDAAVLVISKGDDRLLAAVGSGAGHFPQDDSGGYAGYYPADGAAAAGHLERLRQRGAEFLLVPAAAAWWLDHYADLRTYLLNSAQQVSPEPQRFQLFKLARQASGRGANRSATAMDKNVSDFHRLYYDSQIWAKTTWMGVPCLKTPLDLWVYQEIVYETRPEFIVETGTASGGSALYLAHLMDLLGDGGRVVTVDLVRQDRPHHPRVTYVQGRSSVDPDVVREVAELVRASRRTMVILDSDHTKAHVLPEMEAYAPFVTVGNYLVVEDTNINGHPAYPGFGDGPWEAVEEFMSQRDDFETDLSREKFFLTFNPNGYLRRVK